MAWATVAEVLEQTGETVTEQQLAVASAIIDTYSGADEDLPEDAIAELDRKHLKRATCWQAPWVRDHPGLLTEREGHTQTSADGNSVTRSSQADITLAPLAQRSLRNLSWVSTRSAFVPRGKLGRTLPPYLDFTNERSDEYGTWTPLDIT